MAMASGSFLNENGSFSNVKLGLVKDGTVSTGIDIMTPEKTGHFLSFGFGIEYTGIQGQTKLNQTYGNMYDLDMEAKIGANVAALINSPIPLKLKVGFGYGITRYGSTNTGGQTGSIALESNIYKKLGLGIEWKKCAVSNASEIYFYKNF